MRDLRAVFPKIPVGYPEGSMTGEGNYEHLLVSFLEYQVNKALQGGIARRAGHGVLDNRLLHLDLQSHVGTRR